METTQHAPRHERGTETQSTRETQNTRRAYTAPKLVEYGSVAKLTQGNGTVLSGDGGVRMRI
jgi:hypothetical protein